MFAKEKIYWNKLILFVLLSELAGIIGSFFTKPAIKSWYIYLQKPWFTPPSWLFGPVWTLLYLLMGISIYIIWSKTRDYNRDLLIFYFVHLVVNGLWSIIFFGLKSPFAALVNIIILLVMIAIMIIRFYNVSKAAAYLLVPYILWVSYATILNYSIWMLN